jgi:alginate O-acetyltransferase complex protein AlgI
MVFSSHVFLFYFLPLALGLYYLLPWRAKHLGLALVSYLFYGWANPLFMVLMLFSTLVDYLAGRVMAHNGFRGWGKPLALLSKDQPRSRIQRWALTISIVSNLSLLGFFKYFNFAVENYNTLFSAIGLAELGLENVMWITLPLGISFYTFQSMSYSIDVYRGDAKPMRNLIDFGCYVSMFPQLVAGPIIRFSEVADQLERRSHTLVKFARGSAFIALGLTKKIMLANPCGKVADMAFNAGSVNTLDAWVGAVAYAFQIYFDFSAYSDMAIGLGLMLGFVFAKNFDSPYHAASITEFWRRWHISLSTWLRDYLYIPLGGNRKGPSRTYINLMLVMLLGGLWHGASWNFIIWGGIHGGMLAWERTRGRTGFFNRLPRFFQIAFTFIIVVFAWVFFRASDLPSALAYCGSMLGLGNAQPGAALIEGLIYQPYYLMSLGLAAVITWGGVQTWDWTRNLSWPKAMVVVFLMLLSLLTMTTQAFNPFIYFIF